LNPLNKTFISLTLYKRIIHEHNMKLKIVHKMIVGGCIIAQKIALRIVEGDATKQYTID